MRTITPPPADYRGTIADFVERYVIPNLPPPSRLIGWTEALLDYHRRDDPVCIIRGRAGSRGAPRREGRLTIVESDNSPGRWCYLRAWDGHRTADDLGRVLDDGELPVLYAASRDERRRWTYGQAMSGRDKRAFSEPRLKHCHIEDALDGAPRDNRIRALRNLCPVNHFLWPMPSKFTMRRVGWSEPSMRSDLGESQTVIACVQHRLLEHLGHEGRPVYRRYLEAVQGRLRPSAGSQIIELCPKPSGPSSEPTRRSQRGRANKTAGPRPRSAGFWSAILTDGRANPRAGILAAAPNAHRRLDHLVAGLTVAQYVGIANALFNKCDPKDLRAAAPGDLERQGELAWRHLEDAKRSPQLGGKWRACVDALSEGSERGLAAVAALDLDAFVTATNRVVSQVYRKV